MIEFEYKNRLVKQIEDEDSHGPTFVYICEENYFVSVHDLECYLDKTYLSKLQARKKTKVRKK